MDPVTLGGVACIAMTTLVVGLSITWWMVKSAMRMVMKLVVFSVVTLITLAMIGAAVGALMLQSAH